jgi:hypothetical protein
MYRILNIVFIAAIVISAILAGVAYFSGAGGESFDPGLTVVAAPEQTEAERPPGFPDPEEDWIKLPEGPNLAEGKTVASGEATEAFVPANAVDGDTNTYWESKGLPAEFTVDLGGTYTIQTVGVRLTPAPIWEPRSQNFSILLSTDGVNFTEVAADAKHDFDADSGTIVRVDFAAAEANFVRLIFTAKSSGRSNGAQAAEICVYE